MTTEIMTPKCGDADTPRMGPNFVCGTLWAVVPVRAVIQLEQVVGNLSLTLAKVISATTWSLEDI